MSAKVILDGTSYPVKAGETVLDTLLNAGLFVPHSCRSGTCCSCLMQLKEGVLPEKAQAGLKPTLVQKGMFLACQCEPETPITIQKAGQENLHQSASILEKTMLNHQVMQLKILPDAPFTAEPGQYITLINPNQIARSYSISNNPANEKHITFHIRLLENGAMSQWLQHQAKPGAPLSFHGAYGNCFYPTVLPARGYPILLAGTGTGLAPLYGIVKQALISGHTGSITLLHGALKPEDLYLVDILTQLASQHPQFRYIPCALQGETGQFYQLGDIQALTLNALPEDKSQLRVYLCGAPEMVTVLKTKIFLAGCASKHIFVDAFLPSKN